MSLAATAGEKKLMHCFAFTPIAEATQADWDAWYKAMDELPSKMPGIVSKVWYGKLVAPLPQFGVTAEMRKMLNAGEPKATGDVTRTTRQHGACMEMADEAALKTYASHAAHKEWEAVYAKVRVPGTTTFNIIGR